MNRFLTIIALTFIGLLTTVLQTKAGSWSEYDLNQPVGWGTVDGLVTGSEDENPVTVTTLQELKDAMKGTDKKTIYIQGTIEFTGLVAFNSVENKTIYGLPGATFSNPTHSTKVSESGITSPETIQQLREAGFRGFLIGESFMRAADPGLALKEFIESL